MKLQLAADIVHGKYINLLESLMKNFDKNEKQIEYYDNLLTSLSNIQTMLDNDKMTDKEIIELCRHNFDENEYLLLVDLLMEMQREWKLLPVSRLGS